MRKYEAVPLRLDGAIALAKDTFCVVFSGKDYEDMHSYILVYEGRKNNLGLVPTSHARSMILLAK
ncbi:hypothetical protein ACVIRO_006936 [Rhizobium ruizarguesonis]